MVVGLTGKYCAGKNEAARVFAERGFRVVDVDRLGHQALEASRDEIAARFGPGVMDPHGGVDRKKLGKLVFGDRKKLRDLEDIVHPLMVSSYGFRVTGYGPGGLQVAGCEGQRSEALHQVALPGIMVTL